VALTKSPLCVVRYTHTITESEREVTVTRGVLTHSSPPHHATTRVCCANTPPRMLQTIFFTRLVPKL